MSDSYREAVERERQRTAGEQAADTPLFADPPPPRARNTDPDTSHAAANDAKRTQAAQHAAILTALAAYGPMTGDAIDAVMGWRAATASRRLPELIKMGKVERTEDRAKTRTGSAAYIHRLTGR